MSSVVVILSAIFGSGVWLTITSNSEMCVTSTSHFEVKNRVWRVYTKLYIRLHKVKGCLSSVCFQHLYSLECGILRLNSFVVWSNTKLFIYVNSFFALLKQREINPLYIGMCISEANQQKNHAFLFSFWATQHYTMCLVFGLIIGTGITIKNLTSLHIQ